MTEGRGYMLRINPDDIDLDRFERIAAAGREALEEGEDADAAARFGEALGLWGGGGGGNPRFDKPYVNLAGSWGRYGLALGGWVSGGDPAASARLTWEETLLETIPIVTSSCS